MIGGAEMLKKLIAVVLVVAMMMTMTVTAFASNDGQLVATTDQRALSTAIDDFSLPALFETLPDDLTEFWLIFIGVNDTNEYLYIFHIKPHFCSLTMQGEDLVLCVTITPCSQSNSKKEYSRLVQ